MHSFQRKLLFQSLHSLFSPGETAEQNFWGGVIYPYPYASSGKKFIRVDFPAEIGRNTREVLDFNLSIH